ncbi:MAG TPA: hypothetical protein VGI74_26255 [Streptosporangiaceae bacterium]
MLAGCRKSISSHANYAACCAISPPMHTMYVYRAAIPVLIDCTSYHEGRVSAIEHAKPGATELRTLAAYAEALGGRLEIIADFGDQRLAFAEPGNEAA